MIQSLSVKNFLSFKNKVTFSFEATKDKSLEDYQVVKVAPGVRLLKLGIIYGANASGKSNLIYAFEFIRNIWLITTDSKDETIGVTPFLLDATSKGKPSFFNIIFYVDKRKFDYSVEVNQEFILRERLNYYPGTQPKMVFERTQKTISKIVYGTGIKLNQVEKSEIAIKCLPNMSVFAAYNQVNTEVFEIESALNWMKTKFMDVIEPDMHMPLSRYVENLIIKDENLKENILTYLRKADFNISGLSTELVKEEVPNFFISTVLEESNLPLKEKERIKKEKTFEVTKTEFEHEVYDTKGNVSYYKLSKEAQSEGTIRTFELSGPIIQAIKRNAFLAIDEIESKLHPRLIEYIIENFLRESKESQLLLTTHYDGLLDEDDLLRKDSIWFTEKDRSGSTNLFSLSDFKAVNRISSLLKAYKYGKFGAIPIIE